MEFNGDKANGIIITYIGGGSRLWATQLIKDLACEEKLSGTVKLYDIDKTASKENEFIGNMISLDPSTKGKWIYKNVDTIEEALEGADFIIISILPGTFDEMSIDVHAPEKYGIYQSVGDTTGPGGLLRALRTVPIYVDFAEKIKKYSPSAWVINYTNPMALCTRTLYEIFPGIKAFGCCHEVFGTQDLLKEMLLDLRGINAEKRDDIKVNVLGINHFTWIDGAGYKNIDLLKMYTEFVDKYYETGFRKHPVENIEKEIFISSNRVKFDLFRRFGIIAAAGDRHLAEFLPSSWYLKDPQTVQNWKFHLTPVSLRIKMRKDADDYRARLISGNEKIDIKPTGEEGVRLIKSLLGMGDLVTNVNYPNINQIEGLPSGAIVESNAVFSRDSIKPVIAGRLPLEVHNHVMRHSLNQELTLKAGLEKDERIALNCLMNDPLVNISPDQAKELLNVMLSGTRKYIEGWNI